MRRFSDNERVALVLTGFALLAVIYGLVTPIFEGYDEDSHFAFVQYVASGRGLPRQPAAEYPHLAKHEANQPPLYYLLSAPLIAWLDTSDLPARLVDNPHAVYYPPPYPDNQNAVVHHDDEGFPWQGAVLAVHLVRLFSVLFGVGTLACTFALARTLFPAEPTLVWGALVVNALIPSFIFSSALVSNDGLVTFMSALALLLLARLWRASYRDGDYIVLGSVLGAAALSKLSGLWVWPFAALVLAALGLYRRQIARYLRGGLIAFTVGAIISGWWYARNWVYYRDVTGLNVLLDMIGRRGKNFTLLDFLPETEGIRWSFWALFGWFNVPVADWLYRLYDAALLVALAGMAVWTVRAARQKRWAELGSLALAAGWFLTIVAALVNLNMQTIVAQGRLLFPALSAIVILFVRGWLVWLPPAQRWARWATRGALAAMLVLAIYVPFGVIAPVYATPDSLMLAQARTQAPQAVDARIGDDVTLLGVALDASVLRPGETVWVTLCWRAERRPSENDLLFVQLLVDGDLIAAQKDTYNGNGNFPTGIWPAGIVFCERVPLDVRVSAPDSAATALVIGLARQNGERLPVMIAGKPSGDAVRVPAPPLAVAAGQQRLTYDWGHAVMLTDYRLDRAVVAAGGTLDLTLRWRLLSLPAGGLVATVQVFDERGVRVAQSDARLDLPQAPGAEWEEQRDLKITPDAKPGVYDLRVGLYESGRGRNLPSYRGQFALGGGLLSLWKIRVP
ncbi:MAG: hypothetical protein HZB53_01790 [Chloroflexi bacterium]|nr:hypothetical protein [Chloroflexota bacterium]